MDVLHVIDRILETRLFVVAGTPVNVATLCMFVIIILVSIAISALAQRAVRRGFRRRGVEDEGSIGVTSRLLHYAILSVGFAVGVHTLGINLTALFAAGAVFAVAIGFAMQNISQNFISGIILLAERAIKPGDILEVEGTMVKVIDMGIRATVARTLNEEEIVVPNSILVQSMVKNHTLRDPLYRLRVDVGVVYGSDMKLVMEVLTRTAEGIEWRVEDRKPVVLLTAFGSSSVDFQVSVWINDPWLTLRHKSELHQSIWWALKEVGVVIAFPQLDVHVDPEVQDALAAMARA
jgi:small-conductance mechanosensitive channel